MDFSRFVQRRLWKMLPEGICPRRRPRRGRRRAQKGRHVLRVSLFGCRRSRTISQENQPVLRPAAKGMEGESTVSAMCLDVFIGLIANAHECTLLHISMNVKTLGTTGFHLIPRVCALARKEGFEPSRRFYPAYSLSRGAPSATWVLPRIQMQFEKLAERVGFEPTGTCAPPVFKTGSFNHSDISPLRRRRLLNTPYSIAYRPPLCQQIFIRRRKIVGRRPPEEPPGNRTPCPGMIRAAGDFPSPRGSPLRREGFPGTGGAYSFRISVFRY